MKTKELIKALQEEDPSGELEACVWNTPIYFLSTEPAYYDGCLGMLLTNESEKPYCCIRGYKRTGVGSKVVLHTMDLYDVLLDNPEAVVELDMSNFCEGDKREAEERKWIDQIRKEVREIIAKVDMEIDEGHYGTHWQNYATNRDALLKVASSLSYIDKELPEYKEMLKMGCHIIPWLFREIKRSPWEYWFVLVSDILNDSPEIPEGKEGRADVLQEIYLEWGIEKGWFPK